MTEHGEKHVKREELSKRVMGRSYSTTVYLLNTCPTKKLEKAIPEEAWSGFKQNLNHLRTFGSIVYRRVLG